MAMVAPDWLIGMSLQEGSGINCFTQRILKSLGLFFFLNLKKKKPSFSKQRDVSKLLTEL